MESLKQITERAHANYESVIRRVKEKKIPIEYILKIAPGNYPEEFDELGRARIGNHIVSEAILNSLKATLGIREILDMDRLKANKLPQKTPKIEVILSNKDNGYDLSIADNGVGIKPEDLNRIWEYGFSKFGTSGIGLAGMKEAVSYFGGRIKVESTPFVRTAFNIWIPSQS